MLGAASSMVVMLAAKALACTMLVVSTEYSTCTFENSGNARVVAAPKSRRRRRAPVLGTGGSYSASGASVAVAARTLVAGIPRNDARLDWNALFSGALNVSGE